MELDSQRQKLRRNEVFEEQVNILMRRYLASDSGIGGSWEVEYIKITHAL
jgi:hypothetical protein